MAILYGLLIIVSGVFLLMVTAITVRYGRLRRLMPKPAFRNIDARPKPDEWDDGEVTITWIGHSTLYINFFGTKIITDPVLGSRVGISIAPGVKIGPKRYTPPALSIEDVKDVDLILLSHAHMDHFDMSTLKALAAPHVRVVTAKNTKGLLRRLPFGDVMELGNKEEGEPVSELRVKAFPVRHWGSRFPWNTNYGWNGYILEKRGRRLVFSGDTAWTEEFKSLCKEGPIDWIAIPIGAYLPISFQGAHCTPEQAWQMVQDSGAKMVTPIHWNTFVLSQEPVDEPIHRFVKAAGEEKNRIVIHDQGKVFRLDHSFVDREVDDLTQTNPKNVQPSVVIQARGSSSPSRSRTILDQ
ncbi:L-ascorbate metabolism protein UlaG, beta-lactamase superfamily [Marininema mesophilum]|uniref:L-ascorbate metabolism protein UlaG, beta-lactamase superfamily n=1 Tax=Marininema mesophilum TaxID=1048340 RepID=A0A1H2XYS4_9BACL|nr:MBL fold metallo-hydrolase [Marininema mesophilum]SDW98016.1 L-ascorbate metabolism protein UlaG, beta-lactamase superfamily [Marininema mesophilum]